MKVGSAVLGLHIAVLCVFALTQGCVTTRSQGGSRGARHKGPWKHEYKPSSMVSSQTSPFDRGAGQSGGSIYEPVIIESGSAPRPEPYITPTPRTSPSEIYIVQKGDMLSKLAVEFNTTVATLVQMNNLSNPDVLYVGQELRIPAGSRRVSKSTTRKKAGSIKKGGTYTIRKGDTLSGIALAAGVSIDDLRSLNGIEGDKIIAGETLDIPSYGKVPAATKKTAKVPKETSPEPAPLAPVEPQVVPVETTPIKVDMVEDHVMYPGETLDDVARQYGVSKSEIMRLNNIADETQNLDGQRLRIPIAE